MSQDLLTDSHSNIILDDISDHLPSVISLNNMNFSQCEKVKICSRDTRKKNMDALNHAMEKTDWLSYLSNDVNESFDKIMEKLTELLDFYVPMRQH